MRSSATPESGKALKRSRFAYICEFASEVISMLRTLLPFLPVFNSRLLRVSGLAIMSTLFVTNAEADHFAGASVTYQCTGVPANQYLITLDLYLDCSGVAITPQNISFTNSCGVSFSLTNVPLVLTEEVSQLCGSQLANSTCNGGTLPGIQHYQFQTSINLSPCNAWTISWSICCRDNSQNVQLTPGMYVAATLNNLGGLCDQSPQFGDESIPYVCVNEPMSYNMDVTDANGNTLAYSFISARFASPLPTNVTYTPGFTAALPIPGITLDGATGQIAFTPTVTGNYIVVVEVSSYDAMGNLIGTVMRDFIFVVINCTDPPADNLGPTDIDNGIITSSNDIQVCTGIPFCVDISFSDVDPLAVITLLSQVASELPGSTFVVNGTNPAVATICWTPDPAFSPASVLIDVNDNACPVENLSSYLLTITVVSPPPFPPDPGSNATISACPGDPNVNLFNQLGGSPDAGGVWTGPNGASHSGTFNPSTDLFGVYTYTVGNGCQNASATVTVNSGSAGNAGTSTTLTTCSTSAATNMFALLGAGAAAGGAWSGPSPVVGGNYNPATMTAGVYTYTVAGTPPCPATSATVTVTENTAPNAGTNGTLTVCSTGGAVSLLAQLGGGPQGGGTWAGPSPVGGAGNYNPATMNPGVYTYTIVGVAPCTNATATVTVTENPAVTAGSNGNLSICATGAAVALSASLGGAPQAGGTWSGPSPVIGGCMTLPP
ncbi:MAG: hypothetical protein IPG92_02075 [Flavobacteriales bacterium]|nr:hypothetical protein [Flavobacteriales bacterium]